MAEGLSRKADVFPVPLPMHPAHAREQQEYQNTTLMIFG